jgi:aryl-alcohol dehydrogenase-like predicted oxidoreductase
MELRPLGRTGVQASKLCLGTMMFGAWGNTDHDDSVRIIHHALDAGINFVDTADVYSDGESEEIVGKALEGRRDDVVLATKFWGPMGDGPNRRGVSRRWIIAEVENSLRRLGTEWIDLYQMHRPDPQTDVDETLGALTDLVQQGKVRYVGSSSFSAGQIVEAQWAARDRKLQCFRTEQPPYSPLVRGIELDVLPTAQRHGMGILTYSPLAGGWLSGTWTADSSPTSPARQRLAARFDMSLPDNQRKLEATEQLAKVAEDAGLSLIELAIAFVTTHPAVTSAIIGPRTMEQLDSQLSAADVELDAAVLDRIDEIVGPGVDLNPADTSYGEQVLQPTLRRR